MKKILLSISIFLALASICQTLDPVVISRDNGIAILANLTEGSANLTATLDTLENKTNQTANQTDNTSLQTADDLWSWGRVPVGYEVDRNGSLIRLSGQEWTPSI